MKRVSPLAVFLLALSLSCSKIPPTPEVPELSLTSESAYFSEGTAQLRLTLTSAAATDVVVSLQATGSLDKSRLSFENPVTIPAGNKIAQVKVTVNDEGLSGGSYSATITVSSAGGATVSSSQKSVTLQLAVEEKVAKVSLSGPSAFTDGKAILKLTPSIAPQENITVSLDLGTLAEGKKAIPRNILTFPSTVTMPSGSTAPTEVEVSLGEKALSPGTYYAIIEITNISRWGEVEGTGKVEVSTEGTLTPNYRSDWSIDISSKQTDWERDVDYSVVEAHFRGGKSYGYYLFEENANTFTTDYPTMLDYLEDVQGSVEHWKEEGDPITIYTEDYSKRGYPILWGKHLWYMVGCDEEGNVTGDYCYYSVWYTAGEAHEAYYDKWLGEWRVGEETWTITEKERPISYYIGNQGTDCKVVAYAGAVGELEILSQWLEGTGPDGSRLRLYGECGPYYFSGASPAARIKMDSNEMTATVNGSRILIDNEVYEMDRLEMFEFPAGANKGNSAYILNLPAQMRRPEYQGWQSYGTATWTDVFLPSLYTMDPVSYDVKLEKNVDEPGMFRLVNVYGSAYPYNEPGDWDDSQDYYMVIDATDPDYVYISYTDTGLDWGYGHFVLDSKVDYSLSLGKTLEEVMAEGVPAGVYDEWSNTITFAPEAFLMNMKNLGDGWYVGNQEPFTLTFHPGASLNMAPARSSSARAMPLPHRYDHRRQSIVLCF